LADIIEREIGEFKREESGGSRGRKKEGSGWSWLK
jgi:hypothetical protein